jgi:PII-like signaling protein
MNLQGRSKLLRIFTGEADRIGHDLLYEKILLVAREYGLAGGTVIKGIMSYGASSHVHRARLIELSEDLPVVIEIIDQEEKIDLFLPIVNDLFEQCGKGGLITLENVDVIYYKPKK